jgi:hypothetical protein
MVISEVYNIDNMEYHVMFTSSNKTFYSMMLWFESIREVENWLKSINAIYWEIGI